jgi:hypothetical protein
MVKKPVNLQANGSNQESQMSAPALPRRLPLNQVFDAIESVATQRWQGAWQLQAVAVKGEQLTTRYQGYAPLALYSMQNNDVIGTGAMQQPITRTQVQDVSTFKQDEPNKLTPWRSDALLRALLIESRPGLTVSRLGSQWQFNWQNWSLSQLRELNQRLASVPLHLHQLSLLPSEHGWNGNLTLTNPLEVMP